MLRNSFGESLRSVKTKHRSQFLSNDHQMFFGQTRNVFWGHTVSIFFDFLLNFWKNRFFFWGKSFCFGNWEEYSVWFWVPNPSSQNMNFTIWIDPKATISILLPPILFFFWGGGFRIHWKKRKLYFHNNRLQMLKNRIFWWLWVCHIW